MLNGEESETGKDTVAGLLDELGITPGGVAVEVNLKVVKREEYGNTPLKDSDSVEIVNFVGGG